MIPDLAEIAAEIRRCSDLIDRGVTALREAATEAAEAEHDYRLAKSRAWVTVPRTLDDGSKRLAAEIEAEVDALTATERMRRDLAEGVHRSAWEALRSRRAQLSAWQTLANAHRSEADFARTGPT